MKKTADIFAEEKAYLLDKKYSGVCSIVMQSIDNIKQMYANENEEGFEEHMKLLQESGVFGDKILPEDKEFIDKFLKSTKEEKGAKNNGR